MTDVRRQSQRGAQTEDRLESLVDNSPRENNEIAVLSIRVSLAAPVPVSISGWPGEWQAEICDLFLGPSGKKGVGQRHYQERREHIFGATRAQRIVGMEECYIRDQTHGDSFQIRTSVLIQPMSAIGSAELPTHL